MSIFRKIRKLIRNPNLFMADYLKKNVLLQEKNNNKKNNIQYYSFPIELNTDETTLLKADEESKVFAYIPWIGGHSYHLIQTINKNYKTQIYKINLFSCNTQESRRNISKFARNNPVEYKYFLRNKFIFLKNRLSAVIVTFDWAPVMRLIVEVCHELKIPTILIPHESIFLDEKKYYWDMTTYASVPKCDLVLAWGELQKRIFIERGYPKENIHIVGSPKLDNCAKYTPVLTREQFCHFYGFNSAVPIILFAAQVLDSQIDQALARQAQRRTIADLLEFCEINQCQLLIRQPPNGSDVLNKELKEQLKKASLYAKVDHSSCYQTAPEESIFHSDIVISINSTMLFEAIIMGKKSLSIRYININSIWNDKIIPYAKNKRDAFKKILNLLESGFTPSEDELKRLKYEFSIGEFDGRACARIHDILNTASSESLSCIQDNQNESLLTGKRIDIICISSKENTPTQKYIKELLNCNTLLYSESLDSVQKMNSVDLFLQWGILTNDAKKLQRKYANILGRPVAYIEDGFIRSYDIGLSGEPGLSIIVDDLTEYYDATRPSRLETYLASEELVGEEARQYCKVCIDKIVNYRISKYNAAPRIKLNIGREGKKKLLLVDQRYNDMSVVCGLANEQTFKMMLTDAINNYPDWDIVIKQHPDAIKGGKSSYFNQALLAVTKHMKNVFIMDYDVNPYYLFDIIDEVFVCTSQLGFEACMAGKKVHCYGMPFYAGWGITNDKIRISRRNKQRDIFDIFYFSYVKLSRYVNPVSGHTCLLEDVIEYMHEKIKNS